MKVLRRSDSRTLPFDFERFWSKLWVGYPIIVTGGAGYIGSHICVALIEAGFAPVIVDDLSNAHRDVVPRIKKITGVAELPFYEMDVRDSTGLESIFSDHQAAAVIHLAAKKSVEGSVTDPLAYYSANIGGLISLLQVMKKVGVKNLVYSSSATVYAPSSEEFILKAPLLGRLILMAPPSIWGSVLSGMWLLPEIL